MTPIVYRPELEHAEPNEAETAEKLVEVVHEIQDTTSKAYAHAVRGAHAKSHALLRGTLRVLPVEKPYAQGLFAAPATYPVVLRLSTAPGDVLPDSVSATRGLALKVFDVPGERVPGTDPTPVQDFVLVDGPAFGVAHAREFEKQFAMVAKTTERATWLKSVLSGFLRAVETVVEASGHESVNLANLGGKRATHPFADAYYSVTPFLYGQNVAKFSLAPITQVPDKHLHVIGHQHALREALDNVTSKMSMVFELRVQLCVDEEQMPIEDAAKRWDESLSPFVPVARLEFPVQHAWSDEASKQIDDGMAFDIWHALAAHRPLGSINRARRVVYASSQAFRSQFNGCPLHGR